MKRIIKDVKVGDRCSFKITTTNTDITEDNIEVFQELLDLIYKLKKYEEA